MKMDESETPSTRARLNRRSASGRERSSSISVRSSALACTESASVSHEIPAASRARLRFRPTTRSIGSDEKCVMYLELPGSDHGDLATHGQESQPMPPLYRR